MTDREHAMAENGEGGHLDEVSLEALATDREDLVSAAALAHLDACERCAARVGEELASAADASVALRRAMPELDELDAMVARAMEKASEPDPLGASAPSRRSLRIGAGVGGLLAVLLAALSAPGTGSLSGLATGLTTSGGQALTLLRAADRVVESSLPGGWIGVALLGLASALLLAVPARLLLRDSGARGASLLTGSAAALLLVALALPASRAHAYRLEGAWPDPQPRVRVDVEDQPTSEALRQAAESAGLGVVVRLEDDPRVTMHLRGAPIGEVVEALLGQSRVVVRPGASLITVRPDDAPLPEAGPAMEPEAQDAPAGPMAPPPPDGADAQGAADAPTLAVPAAPPAAPGLRPPRVGAGAALGDLVTLGGDAEVGSDEAVRGVYTMGGSVRIRGHAYGDVVTMGGDADVEGEVVGNVTTMGGDIAVGPNARVHGDLNAMGGDVDIDASAVLYGRVLGAGDGAVGRGARVGAAERDDGASPGVLRWALWNALIFLFGLVMLGTSRERFGTLRGELAGRPVRSALGGLFGLLAGGALAVVFTCTLIGIPAAMAIGVLLASGYVVGWGTSAWWLGSVLPISALADRPVLQLAVGVGLLFLIGLIPVLGTLLVIAAALAGLGAVIATSFGKNPRRLPRPRHVPTGPFRTSA